MAVNVFNDNIDLFAPKSLDNRYIMNGTTVYVDVDDANANILQVYRHLGLTVLIGITEYWYQEGVTDLDLVPKLVASPAAAITANNALNMSTATNVQLGGTGIKNTLIEWNNFVWTNNWTTLAGSGLVLSSTSTAATANSQILLNITLTGFNTNASQNTYGIRSLNTHSGNTSTNFGIYGEASGAAVQSFGVYGRATESTGMGVRGNNSGGGYGVYGDSISGVGTQGISSSGSGVIAASTTGLALGAFITPSTTNTVVEVASFVRRTSGSPAAGIGGFIDLGVSTSTNITPGVEAVRLGWLLTTAVHASRVSQFEVSTTNAAVLARVLALSGPGQLFLDKYGVNSFTGVTAKLLAVTSAGAVIEADASGIGGFTVDNGLSTSTATNFQLGSATTNGAPLLHDTYIDATSSYTLNVVGNATYTFHATTTTNRAIYGESTAAGVGVTGAVASGFAGIGVQGSADNTNGVGVYGNSIAGIGVNALSETGLAGVFTVVPASTNTAVAALRIARATTGTAANGIGAYITFQFEYSSPTSSDEAARIGATFTDVAARTSAIQFTTKLTNSVVNTMTLHGTGDLELHTLGTGLIERSADGTRYRLTPANGGGSSIWTAV